MFPSLMFTLSNQLKSGHGHHDVRSQRMMLQGLDCVCCDCDLCTPQLGAHSIFKPHLNGAGARRPSDDVVLLGAIFLRTCYSVFDVDKQQIGFACTDSDMCLGGRNPKLQFSGDAASKLLLGMQMYIFTGVSILLLVIPGVLMCAMMISSRAATMPTTSRIQSKSIDSLKINGGIVLATSTCAQPRSDEDSARTFDWFY
ncbi:Cathepsin-like aspartic protease a1, partial [Globisporangium splendens]